MVGVGVMEEVKNTESVSETLIVVSVWHQDLSFWCRDDQRVRIVGGREKENTITVHGCSV